MGTLLNIISNNVFPSIELLVLALIKYINDNNYIKIYGCYIY